MSATSAKIGKEKQPGKMAKIPLDTFSGKRGRGRPRKIQPSWVCGRAENYRWIFDLIWPDVWPGLSKSQTPEDVVNSFSVGGAEPYSATFAPIADLILKVVRDPKRL